MGSGNSLARLDGVWYSKGSWLLQSNSPIHPTIVLQVVCLFSLSKRIWFLNIYLLTLWAGAHLHTMADVKRSQDNLEGVRSIFLLYEFWRQNSGRGRQQVPLPLHHLARALQRRIQNLLYLEFIDIMHSSLYYTCLSFRLQVYIFFSFFLSK